MKAKREALVAVCLAAAALTLGVPSCRARQAQPKVIINGQAFAVELADTQAKRAIGLSNRQPLPGDRGMLFIFEEPQNLQFHMKDCYSPIDIAFIDSAGRIVNIDTMAVESDPANPRRIYQSDRPAQYALETAGGTFARIAAQPGMQAEFVGVGKGKEPGR